MTDDRVLKGPSGLPPFDEPPPCSDEDYFGRDPAWEENEAEEPFHGRRIIDGMGGQEGRDTIGLGRGDRGHEGLLLKGFLKDAFRFDAFRPYQESVCESVFRGKDVLLVMPTGSGKSLCYQLPGIARGGTTLVVSPLIALMEDQAAGLKGKGFAAERIHSGRTRLQSRQVSRQYLDGRLDFLFIAPERMAVPGFPEMLARRKPTLIAIDEAHCISHWGHDFRPDYRLLGERLPILRPAPVMAMTATATPRVQEDIIRQLGMAGAERCIHGFRRTNIAIEIVELPPTERPGKVLEVLRRKEARPAIVYAPTRQKTETLADELGKAFSAASYHAGLTSETRDRIQTAFFSGELDAVVATIAFGMGIDKPDIRTVIHTALPGSLEEYYQEIGRAGRDGNPSRAILLHSYGDRRVHQFFHEKSYPPENVLIRIHDRLTEKRIPVEQLRIELKMEEDEFDAALEKLWIHGGAVVDPDETARRGGRQWAQTYNAQKEHRLGQLDEMSRFADSFSCRMLYLVRHFGDLADHGRPCGLCDFCSPEKVVASLSRRPDREEERIIWDVISTLKGVDSLSTGVLYSRASPGSSLSRSHFEKLLRSLAKADLLSLSEHHFEKAGEQIHYRRAELTRGGCAFKPEDIASLAMAGQGGVQKIKGRIRAAGKTATTPQVIRKAGAGASENPELYAALREWRTGMAKKKGLPAFRIFTNTVLGHLASDLPTSYDELHMTQGVGPRLVEKYGKDIIRIVKAYMAEKR